MKKCSTVELFLGWFLFEDVSDSLLDDLGDSVEYVKSEQFLFFFLFSKNAEICNFLPFNEFFDVFFADFLVDVIDVFGFSFEFVVSSDGTENQIILLKRLKSVSMTNPNCSEELTCLRQFFR